MELEFGNSVSGGGGKEEELELEFGNSVSQILLDRWELEKVEDFYFSNSPPLKIINRFLILKDKPTFSQSFLKKKN